MDDLTKTLPAALATLGLATKDSPANTKASGAKLREQRRVSIEAVADCFKGFSTYSEPMLERMLRESARFAAAMCSADHPAYWLSLLGPSGTGKSMLAKGLARLFSRHLEDLPDEIRNTRSIDRFMRMGGFLSWPKCIDCMLAGDFGFMHQACQDWFLVLDDVGAEHERLRDLSAAKLFAILNARQNRFTVLTANLGIAEIAEKLDTRISSRLLRHGGTVIDTTGTDDHALRKRALAAAHHAPAAAPKAAEPAPKPDPAVMDEQYAKGAAAMAAWKAGQRTAL